MRQSLRRIQTKERGATFVNVLILLCVGSLLIPPTLNLVQTGLVTTEIYEAKMNEIYAADAGIEDALYKIITNESALLDLDEDESYSYSLPSSVGGLTVNANVTKVSVLEGILGEDEYKLNQPHEDWIELDVPDESKVVNTEENWVEYRCDGAFQYTGAGNRTLHSVGAFFFPPPGDESLIDDPYDVVPIPIINFTKLESTETKVAGGAFAFIWRWEKSKGPVFSAGDPNGSLSFKFKIHDATWEYSTYFLWATFKEEDISFAASGEFNKWLVETSAGDTTIKSGILYDDSSGDLTILTWQINPPS